MRSADATSSDPQATASDHSLKQTSRSSIEERIHEVLRGCADALANTNPYPLPTDEEPAAAAGHGRVSSGPWSSTRIVQSDTPSLMNIPRNQSKDSGRASISSPNDYATSVDRRSSSDLLGSASV